MKKPSVPLHLSAVLCLIALLAAFLTLGPDAARAQTLPGSVTNVPQPNTVISQLPGIYSTIINGGTNNIAGLTTNSYTVAVTNVGADGRTNVTTFPTVIQAVSEHQNVGLGIYEACQGNANATNGGTVYALCRSFDNANTFETTPYKYVTNTPPTAPNGFTNIFLYDIPVTNATHIAIVSIGNTGTTAVTRTNVDVYWNLNSDLKYTTPASH